MVDEEEPRISVAEESQAWYARCAFLHCHEAAKLALSTSERGTLSVEVSYEFIDQIPVGFASCCHWSSRTVVIR